MLKSPNLLKSKFYRDTGSSSSAPPPSTTQHQPQQQQQQARAATTTSVPSYNPPATTTPAPKPVVLSQSAPGILTTFRLNAQHGAPDRVAVDAQQFADHFLFDLKPSQYDTDVEVKLEGTSLLYLTTHSVQEGNATKTIKGTQGISLPFSPAPDTITLIGKQVKIAFPR